MTGAFYFVCKKLGMRNGSGGAQNGKRRFFLCFGDSGKPDGWGIRVAGRTPLRWPDRAADAPHRRRAG